MCVKLKAGVIGLHMGEYHVTNFQNDPRCECVAICDLNQELLDKVGDEHGIKKRYSDYRLMLESESLDVVSVAVPNKLHSKFSIDAMRAGCHVLCEKPMAKTVSEAEEMMAVSKETKKQLMVHFNYRALENYPRVREMIEKDDFGEIYFMRTVFHRRDGVPWWYPISKEVCGGGPMMDLGVHALDRAMWLAGYPKPQWVLASTRAAIAPDHRQAKLRNINYDLEDFGVAMIKMSNGMMLELEASWACHHNEAETLTTQIYGTKAGAMIDRSKGVKIFKNMNGNAIDIEFSDANIFASHLGEIKDQSIIVKFIDSIIDGTPQPCRLEDSLTNMRIIQAIYESSRTGHPVSL